MTMYVGEQFRVEATAEEYDGTDITDTNVSSVTVTIYDADLVVLINAAPMTWSSAEQLWFYKWDTTGYDPGSYRAKIIFVGADGKSSWEWRKVRLARNPA